MRPTVQCPSGIAPYESRCGSSYGNLAWAADASHAGNALAARLQELKKPLSYTDRAQDLPFWQQVNQRLTTAIGYEGKLSGT
jgi:hypothetical protein